MSAQKKDGLSDPQRYRIMVEHQAELLFTTDSRGRLDFCNRSWCLYTGLTLAQSLGVGWLQTVHPAERERVAAELESAVQRQDQLATEFRIRGADGIYRWHAVHAIPYRENERIAAWLGSAADITKQKQAEEALRSLAQLTSDFVVRFRVEGNSLRLDTATEGMIAVTGYSLEELQGSGHWDRIVHPDDRDAMHAAIARVLHGESVENSVRVQTKSGGLRDIHYFANPIWDESGKQVTGVISAAQDVSQQRASETRLAAHQRAILELSTPVLQIYQGILIVPLIGEFSSERAKQATARLLNAIRQRRARAVVLDITGLFGVDTRIASHFFQTVEAGRLLGAEVIISGMSSETAATLVGLGVEMTKLQTVADLQSGIELANEIAGYQVVKLGKPRLAARRETAT